MTDKPRQAVELDPGGFNEIRMCRTGPMVYNRNDVYAGGALRKYGEYSWFEQELFARLVRPGQIVVEAGTNIGMHTVVFSRLAGTNGLVFAFEPQRIVFQTLCANLALNQCVNVYAYQAALGAKDGTILAPNIDPTAVGNFGGIPLAAVEIGDVVPERTLDSHKLPGCHFLKADVEGMEAAVLRGARRTIETHRPLLYVENDRQENSRELIELVMSMNYALYWHLPPLFNPGNFAGDPEDIFPGIVSFNMLCVPAETGPKIEGLRRIASPADWVRD
jgi:FkbM family methyltransferase